MYKNDTYKAWSIVYKGSIRNITIRIYKGLKEAEKKKIVAQQLSAFLHHTSRSCNKNHSKDQF